MVTQIIYLNRQGRRMVHSLGIRSTMAYARNCFRENIAECQGAMSLDERRTSQFKLLAITNTVPEA